MALEKIKVLEDRSRSLYNGRCALTVMAKAPRPGAVKTRLCPPLTPDQAASLSMSFLRDTAQAIAEVAPDHAAGVVSYTPPGMEAQFEAVLPDGFLLLKQRGDGFGERLLNTAEDVLAAGFGSVCLIDSDSPTVPIEAYRQAVEALHAADDCVVLGPTVDGGYYLIGMRQPVRALFDDIDWSTEKVFAQTVEKAVGAGLKIVELPIWYDIDDSASLGILRAELLAGIAPGFALTRGAPAPHTAAMLNDMDLQHEGVHGDEPEAGGEADTPVEGAQRPLPNPLSPGESKR